MASMPGAHADAWLLAAGFGLGVAGVLLLGWRLGLHLRRREALRQAQRHDANTRALLRIADELLERAPVLERCGLGTDARRWAGLCRSAAHDQLAIINRLLLLSMRASPRER